MTTLVCKERGCKQEAHFGVSLNGSVEVICSDCLQKVSPDKQAFTLSTKPVRRHTT